jgi:hypothetical protein
MALRVSRAVALSCSDDRVPRGDCYRTAFENGRDTGFYESCWVASYLIVECGRLAAGVLTQII